MVMPDKQETTVAIGRRFVTFSEEWNGGYHVYKVNGQVVAEFPAPPPTVLDPQGFTYTLAARMVSDDLAEIVVVEDSKSDCRE